MVTPYVQQQRTSEIQSAEKNPTNPAALPDGRADFHRAAKLGQIEREVALLKTGSLSTAQGLGLKQLELQMDSKDGPPQHVIDKIGQAGGVLKYLSPKAEGMPRGQFNSTHEWYVANITESVKSDWPGVRQGLLQQADKLHKDNTMSYSVKSDLVAAFKVQDPSRLSPKHLEAIAQSVASLNGNLALQSSGHGESFVATFVGQYGLVEPRYAVANMKQYGNNKFGISVERGGKIISAREFFTDPGELQAERLQR